MPLQACCAEQSVIGACRDQRAFLEALLDQLCGIAKRVEQPGRGIPVDFLQVLLILTAGVGNELDNDGYGNS